MNWPLWGVILFLQNFSFTLVSRSRNSKSIKLHAACSLFSNGTWILSQIIVISGVSDAWKVADWTQLGLIAIFYTTITMIGSLTSHWIAMHWVEPWFKS